jgi:quercetin dioxygenase-like cupin family protein
MATNLTDQRGTIMKSRLWAQKILFILFFVCNPLIAQDAKVTPVVSKQLADIQGKEVQIFTVEYPPGGHDPVHRHNAHAFVYVLEGSIVMGLNGGKPVTVTAGQTFYEGPNDIHTVGDNASKTEPAKFVVFMLKDKDAPILIPVK